MRKTNAILVILMMSLLSLSGCFGEEEVVVVEPTSEYFDFEDMLDGRTWYHYPGGVNAMNNTTALGENNIPYYASSSYYGIGMSTFEPTMGITSTGNLYIIRKFFVLWNRYVYVRANYGNYLDRQPIHYQLGQR